MDKLREYVSAKLDEIHNGKKGKVEPDHVTMIELTSAVMSELKGELNAMFKEGEITVGDTLNGEYIVKREWRP
ncbi:MAG: hypothetical protein K5920_09385 [Bacteroidales bacterium]|nr:hypothetical protein [Bacteroidales bacterium]